MSTLRILWPSEDAADLDADEPAILPMHRQPLNVVERARTFYNNRRCAVCGYPAVMPIELDDAVLNKCGRPIPGTATLVGFRCCGCRAEWAV